MTESLPHPVQLLLNEYLALVNNLAPGLVIGLYLHGSLALGAFDPGLSDVDFIAITSRRCTAFDIQRLQTLHSKLTKGYPHVQLEGSYLQWEDLGGSESTVPPHAHIHDGVLHGSGYHDINGVTWWILKHHGIALVGPPVEQLHLTVDWDELIGQMHQNMKSYWVRFTTDPRRIAWLYTDYGIQWAVLGVLRQYYTFRERAITSKVGAGVYALVHVPPQWHPLVREAIAIRKGMPTSAFRFRLTRALSTRAFLQLIITACNKASR